MIPINCKRKMASLSLLEFTEIGDSNMQGLHSVFTTNGILFDNICEIPIWHHKLLGIEIHSAFTCKARDYQAGLSRRIIIEESIYE